MINLIEEIDKHSSKKSQDRTKTTQDFILDTWHSAFLELFVTTKPEDSLKNENLFFHGR